MEPETPSLHAACGLADAWDLDPGVAFLNHGSFGAAPRPVLEAQARLRRQMEREPVRFLVRECEPLLDQSRRALADVVGADPHDLVFVRNATTAVNSVLRSLAFRPGDEILLTDHAYNACRAAVEYVARRTGARVVTAAVPFPIDSPRQVVEAVLACTSARTRLAVLDHITSPTAVVLPIEDLVRDLACRGVDTLVDGAHTPGMLPLDLARLGAAYYAGNCHKWLCAPKGAGFLFVRRDRQKGIQPAVISHGYNRPRANRPPLHAAFDWTGTDDPTPWLCVGEAIRFLESLLDGGLPALMEHNHRLAIQARRLLAGALGCRPPCPESMLGLMAALPLPDDPVETPPVIHPLSTQLLEQYGIEVPVYHWPDPPRLWLRVSAQAYNRLEQYERLASALAECGCGLDRQSRLDTSNGEHE